MAAIHETMEALHHVGIIDKQAKRRFRCCLPYADPALEAGRDQGDPGERTRQPNRLRQLPQRATSLVSKWERGEKRPSAASLRLLSVVEKNGLAAVA